LVNRRHQLVTLSSTSANATVLSGIQTIFQMVPDTGRTAGLNVTLYGRCTALRWEPVGRGPHQQSQFKYFLNIVYGLFQLKYVTWISTIHNMFDWIYAKDWTENYKIISTNTTCSL